MIVTFVTNTNAQPIYSSDGELGFKSAIDAFESADYALAFSQFQDVYQIQPEHFKTTVAGVMAAKSLYQLENYSQVIALLSEFLEVYSTSRYREVALQIMAAAEFEMQSMQRDSASIRLGVALPLDQLNVTRSLLQGILLSVRQYNRFSEPKIKIIFRDTNASPEGTLIAIRSLVDEGVIAVIGPLFSEHVDAAARVTEQFEVPLIAPLATDDGVTSGHNYVFQVNATPAERGRAIARESIDYLKVTQIGIITESESTQSHLVAQGFTEELNSHGLSSVFNLDVESSVDWARLPLIVHQDTLASAQAILFSVDHDNESQAARHVQDGVNSIGQIGLRPYILGPYSFQSLNLESLRTQISAFFVDTYYENDLRVTAQTFIRDFKESNNGLPPDLFAYIGYDIMEMLSNSFDYDAPLFKHLVNAPPYEGIRLRIHFGDHRKNTGMYLFEQTPIGPQLIR
ncbi:MAG: ABC transporter substrate-binding protein [Bacteroidetes bacterium]|nr:ABC transporter substrate-binding protein [Bacteroidota bacterium]MCY4234076.1 ABC transporter substrate-binding protein [Bacteroidota bacterium]